VELPRDTLYLYCIHFFRVHFPLGPRNKRISLFFIGQGSEEVGHVLHDLALSFILLLHGPVAASFG